MNNKGFTMIELVIVFFIILIIASIGTVNFLNTQRKQALKADEMAVYQLNDSTETYALVSGTSLEYADSDFVFNDCKVGGNLSVDLMIAKLMENGFLISEPQVQSKDAEFSWDSGADKWMVIVN